LAPATIVNPWPVASARLKAPVGSVEVSMSDAWTLTTASEMGSSVTSSTTVPVTWALTDEVRRRKESERMKARMGLS